MAGLMLVNPRRRRKTTRKRRRVAAANPRRRRRSTTRRRARRNPTMYANRRRRRTTRRRARRNPKISVRGFQSAIMPALIGGAGSVALDAVYNQLPLPDMLKSGGIVGTLSKSAVIFVGGNFLGQFIGRRNADIIVAAGLAIQAYNQVKEFAASAGVPGLSAYVPMSEYIPQMGYANAAPGITGPVAHSYPMTEAYMPSDGMSESDYY